MSPARRAYAAFIITSIVWGTTYLAIRIALETIPPMLMASARWIVAGTVLIAVLAARGEKLPGPRDWPALTILGILILLAVYRAALIPLRGIARRVRRRVAGRIR